jgi:hypothetical protein
MKNKLYQMATKVKGLVSSYFEKTRMNSLPLLLGMQYMETNKIAEKSLYKLKQHKLPIHFKPQ